MSCLCGLLPAVQHLFDRCSSRRIALTVGLQRIALDRGVSLRLAALRTAIGKARLPWPQLKFFAACHARFDGKRHGSIITARPDCFPASQ